VGARADVRSCPESSPKVGSNVLCVRASPTGAWIVSTAIPKRTRRRMAYYMELIHKPRVRAAVMEKWRGLKTQLIGGQGGEGLLKGGPQGRVFGRCSVGRSRSTGSSVTSLLRLPRQAPAGSSGS
jgi:hypothetical protein